MESVVLGLTFEPYTPWVCKSTADSFVRFDSTPVDSNAVRVTTSVVDASSGARVPEFGTLFVTVKLWGNFVGRTLCLQGAMPPRSDHVAELCALGATKSDAEVALLHHPVHEAAAMLARGQMAQCSQPSGSTPALKRRRSGTELVLTEAAGGDAKDTGTGSADGKDTGTGSANVSPVDPTQDAEPDAASAHTSQVQCVAHALVHDTLVLAALLRYVVGGVGNRTEATRALLDDAVAAAVVTLHPADVPASTRTALAAAWQGVCAHVAREEAAEVVGSDWIAAALCAEVASALTPETSVHDVTDVPPELVCEPDMRRRVGFVSLRTADAAAARAFFAQEPPLTGLHVLELPPDAALAEQVLDVVSEPANARQLLSLQCVVCAQRLPRAALQRLTDAIASACDCLVRDRSPGFCVRPAAHAPRPNSALDAMLLAVFPSAPVCSLAWLFVLVTDHFNPTEHFNGAHWFFEPSLVLVSHAQPRTEFRQAGDPRDEAVWKGILPLRAPLHVMTIDKRG